MCNNATYQSNHDDHKKNRLSFSTTRSSMMTSSSTLGSFQTSPHEVKFHNVIIRQYSIVIGDNPSCSHGPPISLGWCYTDNQEELAVETYEKHRKGKRRSMHEMRISANKRHRTLKEWGFDTPQIKQALQECAIIQEQRYKTMKHEQRKARRKKLRKAELSKIMKRLKKLCTISS
jgi:hypothetical protein